MFAEKKYYDSRGIYKVSNANAARSALAKSVDKLFTPEKLGNTDNVLYIGVGSGQCKIFFRLLSVGLKQIAENIKRMVVTDLSPAPIESLKISIPERETGISFKHIDLLTENMDPPEKFECVISMFSFTTLAFWVEELNFVLTRVKSLLKENGTGVFVFESYNYFYSQIIEELAKQDPWKEYLSDIPRACGNFCPYFTHKRISKALIEVGLREKLCHSNNISTWYTTFEELREDVRNSYKFDALIPDEKLDSFYEQVRLLMIKKEYVEYENGKISRFVIQDNNITLIFKNMPPDPSQSNDDSVRTLSFEREAVRLKARIDRCNNCGRKAVCDKTASVKPGCSNLESGAATATASSNAGIQPAGNQAAGNQAAGNQAAGNQAAGNQAAGNQAAGNQDRQNINQPKNGKKTKKKGNTKKKR